MTTDVAKPPETAVNAASASPKKKRPRRLPPRGRKFLLAVHVIFSVAWIGVSSCMVVLSLMGLSFDDPGMIKGIYEALKVLDLTVITITSVISVVTGILLACFTPWGLFTHWWVVIKLVLSLIVFLFAFTLTHPAVLRALETAYAHTGSGPLDVSDDGVPLAIFAPVLCSMLLVAAILSFTKPGGTVRRNGAKSTAHAEPNRPAIVHSVRKLTPGVITLRLTAPDGAELPAWEPGAHIDLVLDSGRVRQYSLHGDPADRTGYDVAVLKEPEGRGGSLEIHELGPGCQIEIRGPRNNFPLVDAPAYLFVAGGIGVTPFLPMIRQVEAQGRPWRLLYRGRSANDMAFAKDLRRQYWDKVMLMPSDTTERPDLHRLVEGAPQGSAVYCCGPDALMAALGDVVRESGAHTTLYRERFTPSDRATDAVDEPFTVELSRSGQRVRVSTEETMLEAMRDVASATPASCENGMCGSCELSVLKGTPDHRDDVLDEHERDRIDVIYPCISRSKSPVIVVDA